MIGKAFVAAALVTIAAGAAAAMPSYVWQLPSGISPPPVPANNPMSDAKVALGRRLFYDADLSRDGTTSCGTCHEQHRAFTEGNASHPGVGGAKGRRNVMGLANVGYFTPLTWADSTQHDLEGQMLVPLEGTHPTEMGMTGQRIELVRRLSSDSCYRGMFATAFPETAGRIDVIAVSKALASFERTLISRDAPYDRFMRGDGAALSAAAQRGLSTFDALHCDRCHGGPDFTDLRYHVVGLRVDGVDIDRGLIEITHKQEDDGAIRTPTLRNVALTGPYMHNGSVKNLAEAIRRHFDNVDGARDPALRNVGPDEVAIDDLVAFLASLTDTRFVGNPAFSLPQTACGKPNY
jgi:cytochrome c peroxidase